MEGGILENSARASATPAPALVKILPRCAQGISPPGPVSPASHGLHHVLLEGFPADFKHHMLGQVQSELPFGGAMFEEEVLGAGFGVSKDSLFGETSPCF